MTVIGVVGSRRRNSQEDFVVVRDTVLAMYEPGDQFVSGGCPKGGDAFIERIARELGAPILIYHADWNGRGRSAGFYRNRFIADAADVLIACVAFDRTGGTEDTIRKFEARTGVPAVLC